MPGRRRERLGPGAAGAGRVHVYSIARFGGDRLGFACRSTRRGSAARPGPPCRRRSRLPRRSPRRRSAGPDRAPGPRTRTGRRTEGAPRCRSCRRPAPGSRRRRRRRSRSGACAASCRPSRIVSRQLGSIWTWRAGAGLDLLHTRPAASSTCMPTWGRGDRAAVGDRRVGDRHLQRVGLQVALADREVDVVARRPGPVGELFPVELVAPGGGRQQARRLARQVDPGLSPDPELVRPALQRQPRVHAVAERVVEDVGGDLEGAAASRSSRRRRRRRSES